MITRLHFLLLLIFGLFGTHEHSSTKVAIFSLHCRITRVLNIVPSADLFNRRQLGDMELPGYLLFLRLLHQGSAVARCGSIHSYVITKTVGIALVGRPIIDRYLCEHNRMKRDLESLGD